MNHRTLNRKINIKFIETKLIIRENLKNIIYLFSSRYLIRKKNEAFHVNNTLDLQIHILLVKLQNIHSEFYLNSQKRIVAITDNKINFSKMFKIFDINNISMNKILNISNEENEKEKTKEPMEEES